MAFKDVLLQVSSYPEPTPTAVIEQAVDFAKAQGAHLTGLTFKIEIPRVGNALANIVLDIPGMIASEEKKSSDNARKLTADFKSLATSRAVANDHKIESCANAHLGAIVTDHARMHDITIIPVDEHMGLQHYVAESVIFGSGRPTLILPEVPRGPAAWYGGVVGIAWDFSRPAARAVADALPLLKRAKTVRVVMVTREKAIDTRNSSTELARHLSHHGITAVLDEEEAAGRPIGQVLEEWAATHRIDLLVMGAYGHSRLRDFVLGGATRTVISHPKLPVLLSH
ncbi:universal stress protein [Dongia sp. agr-C8]